MTKDSGRKSKDSSRNTSKEKHEAKDAEEPAEPGPLVKQLTSDPIKR